MREHVSASALNDRFYDDGRIRNAYQAGDLALPPEWTPNGRPETVRMPGWYDLEMHQWCEDSFQISTHTGNVAWAMLALLAYYDVERGEVEGGEQYLNTALRMGEWIEDNCRDARERGGYTGGFEGWEPNPTKLLYKSTEHNIDLYAAFQRFYLVTRDDKWDERADHAKQFVLGMWDEDGGKFWTGTDENDAINPSVIPLDVQAWAVLALREQGEPYWPALEYAENHHAVDCGFDFDESRDGVWYEGTAQMALAYQLLGQQDKADALIDCLRLAQYKSGALPAASIDGLTTGSFLPSGDPWLYFRRAHVGATAWLVLAEQGANPF